MVSEAECIDALREAADRIGESPTKTQYEQLDITPSSTSIRRILGGWNAAKEAAGLETYEQGERGGPDVDPKPDWVELPDGTQWEELTGQQRWYYKNRRQRIERKERRRQALRRWLHELKRDELSCVRCGEGRPPCLDFHHTDEKELSVSEMVGYGYSKESIQDEIKECVVLCSNCHRVKHCSPPTPPEDIDSV